MSESNIMLGSRYRSFKTCQNPSSSNDIFTHDFKKILIRSKQSSELKIFKKCTQFHLPTTSTIFYNSSLKPQICKFISILGDVISTILKQ